MPEDVKPVEVPEGHWLNDIYNEKLSTPEAQKALLKYDTFEDAIAGGLEAQRKLGKSFRLPESFDVFDDDKTKEEFQGSLNKLLGVPSKPEELKDLNFTAGLPEGSQPDENLVKSFSQFMIDKHVPMSLGQDGIEFWNTMMQQAKQQVEQQFEQQAAEANKEITNRLGGDEAAKNKLELVRRMFKNIPGTTPEKYENIAKFLIDSKSVLSPDAMEALAILAEQHAGEGTTHTGEGGKAKEKPKTTEEKTIEESPKTSKALGWI